MRQTRPIGRHDGPHLGRKSRPARLLCSAALLLGLLGATSVGCEMRGGPMGPGGDTEQGEPEEEQPTPVVVIPVSKGDVEASISASSTIEAERQVTVHAEATGQIVKLLVEEGEQVKEGQLLARIKYEAQSSQLERANTSLEKNEADYARIKSLFDRGAASREELDNADLAVRNARMDRRDRGREVKNTRVKAPFAGTLTERLTSEGGFISSGAQLFSITDFNTLVARVYVPEKELDRISVGQSAQIVGKAARGREGVGKVERIAPIVDAATGTVKVTVSLPVELSGQQGFLPGMYAEVILTTETRRGVTLVPKPALVRDEDQTYVFVIKGDRAERRLLSLGLTDDEHVEVVGGVEAGDLIIVAGQAGLKDGALVKLVDPSGNEVGAAASGGQAAGSESGGADGASAAMSEGVAAAEKQEGA